MKFDISCIIDRKLEYYWYERDFPEFRALQSKILRLEYVRHEKSWEEEDGLTCVISTKPVDQAPALISSILGASHFIVEDTLKYPSVTPPYRISVVSRPNLLSSKLDFRGELYFEPCGPKQCKQVFRGDCCVNVFGIGRAIENSIIDNLKNSYKLLPQVIAAWNRYVDGLGDEYDTYATACKYQGAVAPLPQHIIDKSAIQSSFSLPPLNTSTEENGVRCSTRSLPTPGPSDSQRIVHESLGRSYSSAASGSWDEDMQSWNRRFEDARDQLEFYDASEDLRDDVASHSLAASLYIDAEDGSLGASWKLGRSDSSSDDSDMFDECSSFLGDSVGDSSGHFLRSAAEMREPSARAISSSRRSRTPSVEESCNTTPLMTGQSHRGEPSDRGGIDQAGSICDVSSTGYLAESGSEGGGGGGGEARSSMSSPHADAISLPSVAGDHFSGSRRHSSLHHHHFRRRKKRKEGRSVWRRVLRSLCCPACLTSCCLDKRRRSAREGGERSRPVSFVGYSGV
eukprot:Rmarinus@m.14882